MRTLRPLKPTGNVRLTALSNLHAFKGPKKTHSWPRQTMSAKCLLDKKSYATSEPNTSKREKRSNEMSSS